MNKLKQILKGRLKQAVKELEGGEDSMPIESLGLSTRAFNRCHNNDIFTVGQLRWAMEDPVARLGFCGRYKASPTYQEMKRLIK